MKLVMLPWVKAQAIAGVVRRQVFIEEQQIDEAEEWDATDAVATHAVLQDTVGLPLATGRVWRESPDLAMVGRLAVLKPVRGRGLGRQVLLALMQEARQMGCSTVCLHAQTSAQAFYAALGFLPEGDVYDEVGIAHINMRCQLI